VALLATYLRRECDLVRISRKFKLLLHPDFYITYPRPSRVLTTLPTPSTILSISATLDGLGWFAKLFRAFVSECSAGADCASFGSFYGTLYYLDHGSMEEPNAPRPLPPHDDIVFARSDLRSEQPGQASAENY
jgi:hypothetical protein